MSWAIYLNSDRKSLDFPTKELAWDVASGWGIIKDNISHAHDGPAGLPELDEGYEVKEVEPLEPK
jgi:hypothetical protein